MRLGFAGAGNIASALARGWADAERGPEQMLFCDAGSGRAAELAERTGGEAVDSLAELAERSDAVAARGQAGLVGGGGAAARRPGRCDRLGARGDPGRAPARALPRGAGGAGDADGRRGGPARRHLPRAAGALRRRDGGAAAEPLRSSSATWSEVPDELMDAATAVMGCSPAYLAIVVQNLAEAGVAEGFDPEQAYELVLETFAGTIELLRRYDPIEVRTHGRLAGRRHRGGARGARRRRRRRRASRPLSAPRWSGCADDRRSPSPASTSPTTSAR